ncbi:phasin family protein [Psychrobacter sp. H8-1]|uniref:phasin family protein n=1 Tax=Psychrobacter sp. H8-1 TaxID=2774129 RepID=UPI001919324E|nr:phasin family protein [Psychrobacter sp. H8-1]
MSQSNPQDFINQFNENTQKMFEPWTKLNQAFLKNAETMTEFSLNTIKSYSEMGLENMRQVAGIDSPESAKEFNSKQAEMLNVISQQMLADAKRMTELGNNMQEEVMKVLSEVHGETNEQVQANMQKATDQAKKKTQEYTENMNKMAEKATEQVTKAAEQATKAAEQATAAAKKAAEQATAAAKNAAEQATAAATKAAEQATKNTQQATQQAAKSTQQAAKPATNTKTGTSSTAKTTTK